MPTDIKMKDRIPRHTILLSGIILCALLAVFVAGCDDKTEEEPYLEVTLAGSANIPSHASEHELVITSNTDWRISAPAWCMFPSRIGKGSKTVVFTVARSKDPREADITVTAGELSETTVITQEGALPADAPEIEGRDESFPPGEPVLLSIGPVEDADYYRWYRNGEEVQSGEDRTYLAAEVGTYRFKVAGVNVLGEGRPSPEKTVTVTEPWPLPGDAPAIRGDGEGFELVELRIDEMPYTLFYRWYRDGIDIWESEEPVYTARRSGNYRVSAVNYTGEGKPSPEKHVSITSETYLEFGDIPASSVSASGVPSFFTSYPAPPRWTAKLTPLPAQQQYEIQYWQPPLQVQSNRIPVYLTWDDGNLYVDNETIVARDVQGIYDGYFEAYTYDGREVVAIDGYSPFYIRSVKTIDFTGKYNDLDVIVGVLAYPTNEKYAISSFTEGYAKCLLELTPAPETSPARAAPAFRPDAEPGLHTFPEGTVFRRERFDPAKFTRE